MTSEENTTATLAYPQSWLRLPGAQKSNMYASKLSKLIAQNNGHRTASKSTVQLMQTLSIYSQVNVPICELNKMCTDYTEREDRFRSKQSKSKSSPEKKRFIVD